MKRADDLLGATQSLGIPIAPLDVAKMLRLLSLLERWNRASRLTGLQDPDRWVEAHLVDSLTVLLIAPETHRLADAGTGPGFPGLPLAIVRPDWHVSLYERHGKRCTFLRAAASDLALPNVTIHQQDFADAPSQEHDLVLSRASWKIDDWPEVAAPWCIPGGSVVAMLGREVPSRDVLAALGSAAGLHLEETRSLTLPSSGAHRTLVRWTKP